MQKNDKNYSFLFSHSTRSTIYIRRVQVSKRLVHSSVPTLALAVGMASFGVYGFVNNRLEDNSNQTAEASASFAHVTSFFAKAPSSDRVEVATTNQGGPALTVPREESESLDKDPSLSGKLMVIEDKIGDQAYTPNIWPRVGKINNEFGFRRNPFGGSSYERHPGIDIDGEKGDLVIAPADGVVVSAGWHGGYGNLLTIDHGNGLTTRYGHLSKIQVQVGDTIKRGEEIALIGTTGRSTGPHLHYEVRINDESVNPRSYLPPEPTEITNQPK